MTESSSEKSRKEEQETEQWVNDDLGCTAVPFQSRRGKKKDEEGGSDGCEFQMTGDGGREKNTEDDEK